MRIISVLYSLIKNILIIFVCHFLFRVRYQNLDILDKYDKCLICPNHSTVFDPIFLFPKVTNMYSVAKSELFKNKFVSNFLTYYNAIPIERDKKDIRGTKHILRVLQKCDKVRLLIFPEGGIFKDNYKYNKRNTKIGAVYISSITNIPIIPVHITRSTCFLFKGNYKFRYSFYP